jgi:hypothetical protein
MGKYPAGHSENLRHGLELLFLHSLGTSGPVAIVIQQCPEGLLCGENVPDALD